MVENHRVLRLDTVRFTQLLDTVPDFKKCILLMDYLEFQQNIMNPNKVKLEDGSNNDPTPWPYPRIFITRTFINKYIITWMLH